MANKVEGIDTLNLSKYWGQSKRTDFFEATLNGTMNFDDYGEYEKFASNSYFPVAITYQGATAISSGFYDTLKIDISFHLYGFHGLNAVKSP